MQRLGATTAELHLAMREAFGTTAGPEGDPLIRLHGDYHLRRVMRSDTGWVVAGFGDDPLIGREAGAPSQGEARFGPPLEDMADLVASLAQVAGEAASFQPAGTSAQTRPLAEGWVAHNRKELLRGYLAVDGIDGLVRRPQIEIDSWLDAAVPPRLARSRSAETAAQYV
jgi:maltokinase